jgi:hypothetical protein
MSQVSNRHSVVPFIAGKTVAFPLQRLAKVGWKTTKNTKAKFANIAVSVPVLANEDIEAHVSNLMPFVRALCETAQDGIIRSLYESNNGTTQSVSDDEIGMASILAFLESESTGGRLTKDAIEKWFDESMKDNLYVVIAEKLGFNDPSENQEKVIGQHIAGYKGVFSSLAGGKTFLQPKQIQSCKTALGLVDDEMSQRLVKRLEQMEKTPDVVELLGL